MGVVITSFILRCTFGRRLHLGGYTYFSDALDIWLTPYTGKRGRGVVDELALLFFVW